MEFSILGLHHVTATVGDAQSDLDFCTGTLGLRLVKKTVNFDNHNVYHFYYGNEQGSPSTLWTTFPYRGMGVPQGVHGAGQIGATSFSVPGGSLDFWRRRLRERGLSVRELGVRFGEEVLSTTDPSGLVVELVASDRDVREGWTEGGVGEAEALRGLHGVSLVVRDPSATITFLSEVLDLRVVDEVEGRSRVAVNGDAPGKVLDIVHGADQAEARNGLGTVHHVAMAIGDGEEQLHLRQDLVRRGIHVTPVMDRQYFKSIYFREPGGVLLEVATVLPGFAVDEPVAELGRALKLPPWEEASRKSIEQRLPAVHY